MNVIDAGFDALGRKAKDRVTGFSGTCTSLGFDVYGCVLILMAPQVGEDGKIPDSRWFDIKRLEVSNERVMPKPAFPQTKFGEENGATDKPVKGVPV